MSRGQLTIEVRLRQQVTRLTNENKKLKEKVKVLEFTIKTLTEQNNELQRQINELKTIVFGKRKFPTLKGEFEGEEIDKKPIKRTKESYQKEMPKDSDITETVTIKKPENIGSVPTRIRTFYTIDIPEQLKAIITKHNIEQYKENGTWKSTVSIPDSKVIFGENLKAMVVLLSIELNLSYSYTINYFKTIHNIKISEGSIRNILHEKAESYSPKYESIKQEIRNDTHNHLDETSFKVKGELHYAWCFCGPIHVAYLMGVTRGKGNAEELRGNATCPMITDDYGAYKNIEGRKQLCWAHLLRHFRDPIQAPNLIDFVKERMAVEYNNLKSIFHKLEEVLTQENPLSQKEDFVLLLKTLSTIHDNDIIYIKRIKKTLSNNIDKYLTCLEFPFLPLTNNRTEQAIRKVVRKRKISYGSTSIKGGDDRRFVVNRCDLKADAFIILR